MVLEQEAQVVAAGETLMTEFVSEWGSEFPTSYLQLRRRGPKRMWYGDKKITNRESRIRQNECESRLELQVARRGVKEKFPPTRG